LDSSRSLPHVSIVDSEFNLDACDMNLRCFLVSFSRLDHYWAFYRHQCSIKPLVGSTCLCGCHLHYYFVLNHLKLCSLWVAFWILEHLRYCWCFHYSTFCQAFYWICLLAEDGVGDKLPCFAN